MALRNSVFSMDLARYWCTYNGQTKTIYEEEGTYAIIVTEKHGNPHIQL